MIVRQHERVPLEAECVLRLVDGTEVACHTLDISVGGLKVTNQARNLFAYIGSECLVEFPVYIAGGGVDPRMVLKTKAQIVNGDPNGVGMKFLGVDQETMALLKKLVESMLLPDDVTLLRNKGGVTVHSPHIKTLKVLLEEHIVGAVKEIFIAFLSINVTPGPYVERPDFDDYHPPDTDVTGVVLFNGSVEGGVHLAGPLHFAVNAAGALLGEAGLDFSKEQEEMVWDAYGEISNQVAGSIQTRLSTHFDAISMTPPSVVVGPNLQIKYHRSLSSVRQFFKSTFGPFYVECFFR